MQEGGRHAGLRVWSSLRGRDAGSFISVPSRPHVVLGIDQVRGDAAGVSLASAAFPPSTSRVPGLSQPLQRPGDQTGGHWPRVNSGAIAVTQACTFSGDDR